MNVKSRTEYLSERGQDIARFVDSILMRASESEDQVPFLLVFQTEGVCQFLGNLTQTDTVQLLQDTLNQLKDMTIVMPAHLNESLKGH